MQPGLVWVFNEPCWHTCPKKQVQRYPLQTSLHWPLTNGSPGLAFSLAPECLPEVRKSIGSKSMGLLGPAKTSA